MQQEPDKLMRSLRMAWRPVKSDDIDITPELFIEANFMCKVFFFLNQML